MYLAYRITDDFIFEHKGYFTFLLQYPYIETILINKDIIFLYFYHIYILMYNPIYHIKGLFPFCLNNFINIV